MYAKLKVSNYRPSEIIARDPSESTYEKGDDKFPALFRCGDIKLSRRIVQCVNGWDALKQSHDELVAALECFVANVDADIIRASATDRETLLNTLAKAYAALAKAKEVTK